jgi:hypothetical protein
VSGAKSYEVQLSPDPMTATSFASQAPVTKSKAVATALTSGARMWARVRAVASAGTGPLERSGDEDRAMRDGEERCCEVE